MLIAKYYNHMVFFTSALSSAALGHASTVFYILHKISVGSFYPHFPKIEFREFVVEFTLTNMWL